MTPRAPLLATLLLLSAATGSVAAATASPTPTHAPKDGGGDGLPDAEERTYGTNLAVDTDDGGLGDGTGPGDGVVAAVLDWLRGLTPVRALLLVGATAVGLAFVRVGYRRGLARYRSYTSPTVVLLDDAALEDVEFGDSEAEARTGADDPDGTGDGET